MHGCTFALHVFPALQALRRDRGPLVRWLELPSPAPSSRLDAAILSAAAALLLLVGAPQLAEQTRTEAQLAQPSAAVVAGAPATQAGPADLADVSSAAQQPPPLRLQPRQRLLGQPAAAQHAAQQNSLVQGQAATSAAAGVERPLVMDSQTLAALALCMAVSWRSRHAHRLRGPTLRPAGASQSARSAARVFPASYRAYAWGTRPSMWA